MPVVGRGSAYADIDGDGDLDFVLTASGSAPRLMRNEQKIGHHWVRFQLKAKGGNSFAYGARVELQTGDSMQQRFVSPTRGYLSQSELPVTFGLGKSEKIESVVIHWPDGSKQELKGSKVDRLNIVEQVDSK